MGGVVTVCGWWDRSSSNPGDEVVETRIDFAAEVVATAERLAQTEPQFQGELVGSPMPAGEFESWVKAR